jgi:tetratricopeptide (TPR) repeat protein
MAGFSLPDSAEFEEWQRYEAAGLRDELGSVLERLVGCHRAGGEYEAAIRYARRWVGLDGLNEAAQRSLMGLYGEAGRDAAALCQYRECARLLEEELGAPPAAETTALYEQILAGELEAPVSPPARRLDLPVQLPSFLDEKEPVEIERAVFVARERELAGLEGHLDRALAGQGRVAFVTGGAGRGKTALMSEFARRAQDAYPDMLAVVGHCNAYSGIGDPYLPFREVMNMLTGDVEGQWAAGATTHEHALRLWENLPCVAQMLVERGPQLVDIFVPGGELLARATAAAPHGAQWLEGLQRLVERAQARPGAPSRGQLFEQCADVLCGLAAQRPVLILLDDLQWADSASISLLFHLARRIPGSRVLIVGAYRPDEIALGRDGPSAGFAQQQRDRHPLEPVLSEFKHDFGDIWIDLGEADEAEARRFVDAYLDSEPNRLRDEFRQELVRHAGGHALFTIELLRDMQERGDLVRDADAGDAWAEGPALDWEALPTRVEGVIEKRVARLEAGLCDILAVASVEGEGFTAEAIARVQDVEAREVVRRLSGELDRQHRLVRARGTRRVEGQRLSRYRFRHILIQRYLYHSLDEVERVYLHEAVGRALERLYGERAKEIAVELARHFQEAGLVEKAVGYLRLASDRAVLLGDTEQAYVHLTRALGSLERLPDTPQRARQELELLIGLGTPLMDPGWNPDPDIEPVYDRARELCQRLGDMSQLFPLQWHRSQPYLWRAEYQTAHEMGEQLLDLAQQAEDPVRVALARLMLGWILSDLGEFDAALAHLEHVITWYDPQAHGSVFFLYGYEPGIASLNRASWALWYLGYPEQALERGQEALTLAQELDQPHLLAASLLDAARLYLLRGEVQAAEELSEAAVTLSNEHGLMFWLAAATRDRARALVEQGQVEEGMAQMRQGMAYYQSIGVKWRRSASLAQLAAAYAKAGRIEEGLALLAEAVAFVEETGECYAEAEIHRLKGELLWMRGVEAEAEASFQQAIEVARRQQAKSLELRATMSLCRLWGKQGKREEARRMLAEIYGWFTEGFDTGDLREAKALFDELS